MTTLNDYSAVFESLKTERKRKMETEVTEYVLILFNILAACKLKVDVGRARRSERRLHKRYIIHAW